jgi:hypothetical protein
MFPGFAGLASGSGSKSQVADLHGSRWIDGCAVHGPLGPLAGCSSRRLMFHSRGSPSRCLGSAACGPTESMNVGHSDVDVDRGRSPCCQTHVAGTGSTAPGFPALVWFNLAPRGTSKMTRHGKTVTRRSNRRISESPSTSSVWPITPTRLRIHAARWQFPTWIPDASGPQSPPTVTVSMQAEPLTREDRHSISFPTPNARAMSCTGRAWSYRAASC